MNAAAGDGPGIRPTLVTGASMVAGADGELHRVTRPVVALCACGRSRIAPWCDSTHKLLRRRTGAGAGDGTRAGAGAGEGPGHSEREQS